MDARRVLSAENLETQFRKHFLGIIFSLMFAVVIVVFALIVIVDAIEIQESKAARTALETTVP